MDKILFLNWSKAPCVLCIMLFVLFVGCSDTPKINNLEILEQPLCKDTKISLKVENVTIREVVDRLKGDMGYFRFNRSSDIFKSDVKFDFDIKDASIFQFVDILSRQTKLAATIFNERLWFSRFERLPQYTIATDSFLISMFMPATITEKDGTKKVGALCRCEYYENEVYDVELKSMRAFSQPVKFIQYTDGVGKEEWLIYLPEGYNEEASPNFQIEMTCIQAKERYLIRINDTSSGKHQINNFELEIEDVQTINIENCPFTIIVPFYLKKFDVLSDPELQAFEKLFAKAIKKKDLTILKDNPVANNMQKYDILRLNYAGSEHRRGAHQQSFRANWSPFFAINGEMHVKNEQVLKRRDLVIDFTRGRLETVVLNMSPGRKH